MIPSPFRHPWRWLKILPGRVKILVTRRTTWVSEDNPADVEVHRESLSSAWQLAGIHSRDWWWVRRYGRRECGCTFNPLTRRRVLVRWRCREHMTWLDPRPETESDAR